MKHFYFLAFITLLWGCQSEEFFEQFDEATSLSSESELSNFISRLTQNPTAFDDFIDESSSLSLEFPFEVSINSNTTFLIDEFSDYQILIDELSSLDDGYSLSISYPVDISLPNYETITIQNQQELEAIDASVPGSSEINCLNYNFPLEVNVFDRENSFTARRSLLNEAQFYNFLDNLEDNGGFYEIIYPINISIEGEAQTVSSNLELSAAIQSLDESCFNPDLFFISTSRLEQFIAFITDGEFRISTYVDEEDGDESEAFEDFRFSFNSDQSISIENIESGETFIAEWQAEIDDGELVFELDFDDNEDLEELAEDWIVTAFANPNTIDLLDIDDDTDEESILIFEKL